MRTLFALLFTCLMGAPASAQDSLGLATGRISVQPGIVCQTQEICVEIAESFSYEGNLAAQSTLQKVSWQIMVEPAIPLELMQHRRIAEWSYESNYLVLYAVVLRSENGPPFGCFILVQESTI